jgi:hypothetical protein
VLFRDNTTLLTFDASLEEFRHVSMQKQQEIHRILTSKNPQQGKNSDSTISLQEIFENSDNPILLVPNATQPFVKLLFLREAQLMLLAVTKHGDILIWEWSDHEFVWKWINKISFMTGLNKNNFPSYAKDSTQNASFAMLFILPSIIASCGVPISGFI